MSTLASDVRVEACPSGWHAWTPEKGLHGFGSTREAAIDQLKDFLILRKKLDQRYQNAQSEGRNG
jgi:hypothetical protein